MGLFGGKERHSVALIDVGSASVGGAYAHFESGATPTIYYTARVPIERRPEEAPEDSMLRSLDVLGHILLNHGAPALRQETGSGRIDSVVVSVAAPWQQTTVRVESIQQEKPFVFTKHLLDEVLAKERAQKEHSVNTGESVIATILNGYEVTNPFGKKASRADLVVLSSCIDKTVAEKVTRQLRRLYHTHTISYTAFAPMSYAVLRDLYPHERDFLILEVAGEATDLAFVKRGLLTDVASIQQGTNTLVSAVTDLSHGELIQKGDADRGLIDLRRNEHFASRAAEVKEKWLDSLTAALKEFSARHALPRTVFLLADTETRGFLAGLLDDPSIHSLWLSDEPLAVIPLSPLHISEHVKTRGQAAGDLFLAMMALYYNKKLMPLPGK